MKKKSLKRAVACVLAVALAAGALAGCGGNSTTPSSAASTSTPASSAAQPEQITFPLAEPVELTIAAADLGAASLADNLPVWQEIERRTNVKVNWDVTAAA